MTTTATPTRRFRSPAAGRGFTLRGFTLLEGLFASATLAALVLGVAAAVSAAQSATMAGQKRIMAVMVADDLLSELRAEPYTTLDTYDGFEQPVGQLRTLDGQDYPASHRWLGRRAQVTLETITEPTLGVAVLGKRVRVTAFDAQRDLVTLEMFVPEPVGP